MHPWSQAPPPRSGTHFGLHGSPRGRGRSGGTCPPQPPFPYTSPLPPSPAPPRARWRTLTWGPRSHPPSRHHNLCPRGHWPFVVRGSLVVRSFGIGRSCGLGPHPPSDCAVLRRARDPRIGPHCRRTHHSVGQTCPSDTSRPCHMSARRCRMLLDASPTPGMLCQHMQCFG